MMTIPATTLHLYCAAISRNQSQHSRSSATPDTWHTAQLRRSRRPGNMSAADDGTGVVNVNVTDGMLGGIYRETSEISMEVADTLEGAGSSWVLGVFLLVFPLTWLLEEAVMLERRRRRRRRPGDGVMVPVVGVTQVTVTSVCILVTSLTHSHPADTQITYAMVTLFVAFSVPGLLNIVLFYIRTLASLLPRLVFAVNQKSDVE